MFLSKLARLFLIAVAVSIASAHIAYPQTRRTPRAPAKTSQPPADSRAGETHYNAGLSCLDDDCRIASYTKAINAGLKTYQVFANRGRAYLAKGEFAPAILDFHGALEIKPFDPEISLSMADAFFRIGELDQALAVLDNVITYEEGRADVYRARAGLLIFSGSAGEALDDLGQAIALSPGDRELLAERADLLAGTGDYPAALKDLSALLSLSPDSNVLRKRAALLERTGDVSGALADLEAAVRILPGDPVPSIEKAALLFRARRLDDALDAVNKALQLAPSHNGARLLRGRILLSKGDAAGAIVDATYTAAADELKIEALILRGNAYGWTGRHDLAVEDATAVLALNDRFVDALHLRALAHNNLKAFSKAIADADRILSLEPQFARAYAVRYVAYNGLGNSEQAQKDLAIYRTLERGRLDRAIEREPDKFELYRARSGVQQDETLALADIRKAMELNPQCVECQNAYFRLEKDSAKKLSVMRAMEFTRSGDAEFFRLRSNAHFEAGDYASSVNDLSKAIAVEPKAYDHYSRGRIKRHYLKQDAEAVSDFLRAIELDPTMYYSFSEASETLVALGRKKEAVEILNKGVFENLKNPSFYHLRGSFYFFNLNDRKNAQADLSRCLSVEPGSNWCKMLGDLLSR